VLELTGCTAIGAGGYTVCTPTLCPVLQLTAPSSTQAEPSVIVAGDSLQLSGVPGQGGDTLEWFTGPYDTTPVGTGTSITVSPLNSLTYYVRTVDTSTACTSGMQAGPQVRVWPRFNPSMDGDNDVDGADTIIFQSCFSGPAAPHDGSILCQTVDFDRDDDIDQSDFGNFQKCHSGNTVAYQPDCWK